MNTLLLFTCYRALDKFSECQDNMSFHVQKWSDIPSKKEAKKKERKKGGIKEGKKIGKKEKKGKKRKKKGEVKRRERDKKSLMAFDLEQFRYFAGTLIFNYFK